MKALEGASMEYKIKMVPTLGECIPLYSVAESMATSDANYGGEFSPSIFNERRQRYVMTLLAEARAGRIDVCDIGGKFGTIADVVEDARLSGFVGGDGTEMLALFTTLGALQEWGEQSRNRHTFIRHSIDTECLIGDGHGAAFNVKRLGGLPDGALPTSTRIDSPSESQPVSVADRLAKPYTHKIRNREPAVLDAEIKQAKSTAPDQNDALSIWGELTKLAENKFGIMIGFSSDGIQYRGKEYQQSGEPDVFKLKNLRERMSRKKRIDAHRRA
jgi:hypothetical protein